MGRYLGSLSLEDEETVGREDDLGRCLWSQQCRGVREGRGTGEAGSRPWPWDQWRAQQGQLERGFQGLFVAVLRCLCPCRCSRTVW